MSKRLWYNTYPQTERSRCQLEQHKTAEYYMARLEIYMVHGLWFSSVTVKTFDVTMQYAETNLLRTSSKTVDWNSNFQVFQSIFFRGIDIIVKYMRPMIIESNVLHRSLSYWESLSCKVFLYSLPKHKTKSRERWRISLILQPCNLKFGMHVVKTLFYFMKPADCTYYTYFLIL